MITFPLLKGATHSARRPHSCRQQQPRAAVVESCAVVAKEAAPSYSEQRRTVYSSRRSHRMPEHASSCVEHTTPAAVNPQQNAVRGLAHNEVPKTVRWSHLHSRLLATLKQKPDLLPGGSRVLVAVSGGQDSMALLRLLIDLQRQSSKHKKAPWPLQLVVGHCDHNIREDSAENAKFVRDQADRMGSWLRDWQAASGDEPSNRPNSVYQSQKDSSAAGFTQSRVSGMPLITHGDFAPIQANNSSILQQQGQALLPSQHLSSYDSYADLGQELLQETTLQPQQQPRAQSLTAFQPPAGCNNSRAPIVAVAADDTQQRRRSSRYKGQRRTRLQQNQDSAKMEGWVHQQAAQLGLQYLSRTATQQLKSEASARSWRHQMLAEMAIESGCSHVVLGHTATDRAETLMFNLVRGAGPSGLCSMGWGRPMTYNIGLKLVRPLLNFTREETAEVCRVTGTQVYEDSTNSDDQYSRNRLRLRVFPHLAAINRLVVQHMAQTCDLLQLDSHLLDSLAQQRMQDVLQDCVLHTVTAEAQQSAQAAGQQGQQELTARPSKRFTAEAGGGGGGHIPATGAEGGLLAGHSTAGIASTAVSVERLLQMPKALQHRVNHLWLRQQLTRSVSYHMVREVQALLGTAADVSRTSTLRGQQCVVRRSDWLLLPPPPQSVMRRIDLLLCVDNAMADLLEEGKVRVTQVEQQHQQQQAENLQQQEKQSNRTTQLHQQCQQAAPKHTQQLQQLKLQPAQPVSGAGAAANGRSGTANTTTTSSSSGTTVRSSQSRQQSPDRWQGPELGVAGCDNHYSSIPAGRRRRKVTD